MAEQVGSPSQALRLVAKDPLQDGGRAPLPSLEIGPATGDLPSGVDCHNDDLWVEQPHAAATTSPGT
jgi:hypothetical protein